MTAHEKAESSINIDQLRKEKEEFDRIQASNSGKTDSDVYREQQAAKGVKVPSPKDRKIDGKSIEKVKKAIAKGDKDAKSKTGRVEKKQTKRDKKVKKAVSGGHSLRALVLAKERYKAKGDVNNNGDWLAITLRDAFVSKVKGKKVFDVDGFTKCCKQNGLDITGPWATNRSLGWTGRYRMNGRQKLEVVLAREGHILLDGKKVKPTGAFLKAMQVKHPIKIDEQD